MRDAARRLVVALDEYHGEPGELASVRVSPHPQLGVLVEPEWIEPRGE